MAERRMFAKTIIDSDAFLDMPLSTQALYFHLSMRADDEGFINNPKKIGRMIGSSDDDLKLLVAKNFIIPFESGIVVIKHWRIHNYLQKDRVKETVYQEEKSQLVVKDNKAYTLAEPMDTICIHSVYKPDTECIQPVSKMDSQYSVDKNRLDKNSIEECSREEEVIHKDIHIRLGSQMITHEQYTQMCDQVGKTYIDQTIQRIVDTPYNGCLEVTKIVQWALEAKKKRSSRRTGFSNYEERHTDYDAILEKKSQRREITEWTYEDAFGSNFD